MDGRLVRMRPAGTASRTERAVHGRVPSGAPPRYISGVVLVAGVPRETDSA